MRSLLRYWLPVVLWAALMFTMSTDVGAPSHTSRIITPILRWLFPDISERAISRVHFLVRKTAHLTEYGIFSLLIWRARRRPVQPETRPWRFADARLAVGVALVFAVTDEWHQRFVPGREGHPLDVLIDTTGAMGGAVVAWGVDRCLRRRRDAGIAEANGTATG